MYINNIWILTCATKFVQCGEILLGYSGGDLSTYGSIFVQ